MDWTTVAVTVVGLLLSGIGVLLWFLYLDVRKKADDAAASAAKAAKDADKRVDDVVRDTGAAAAKAAEDSAKKIEAVSRELADHKLYVAEHYVTQGALTQAIEGLNNAIQALTSGIRDMNRDFSQKLDSLHRRLDGKADKP
jgi:chemotaxis regulatin CheY-phosphate phosphatase CheZ